MGHCQKSSRRKQDVKRSILCYRVVSIALNSFSLRVTRVFRRMNSRRGHRGAETQRDGERGAFSCFLPPPRLCDSVAIIIYCALDLDSRVVIRDAAFGIAHSAFEKRVALRPMDL